MLRFLFVFSVPTFSSYNPDIAKKGACARGVTPSDWGPRRPNQGGYSSASTTVLFSWIATFVLLFVSKVAANFCSEAMARLAPRPLLLPRRGRRSKESTKS